MGSPHGAQLARPNPPQRALRGRPRARAVPPVRGETLRTNRCSVHRRGARPRCWTGATRWSTYPQHGRARRPRQRTPRHPSQRAPPARQQQRVGGQHRERHRQPPHRPAQRRQEPRRREGKQPPAHQTRHGDGEHPRLGQRALRGRPASSAWAAEGPRSPLVGGRSLRGRVVLSTGGGRVRAAGQALPVGVLIHYNQREISLGL
jgi:hypothetical protein